MVCSIADEFAYGKVGHCLWASKFGVDGVWITKGTKSREKHETGRRFRAFRTIS